jgi:hypothetical protein
LATKVGSRQIIHRAELDQLIVGVNQELDNLLESINDELTPPLRMDASLVPDLTVTVGPGIVSNSENGRQKSLPPIGTSVPPFIGGTIIFPSVSGGTITVSPGSNIGLAVSINAYIKILVAVDASGNLELTAGTENVVEDAASVPEPVLDTLPIGYITLFNNGGTIDNVAQNKIFEFRGIGVKSTGGGSPSTPTDVSAVSETGNAVFKLKPTISNFTLRSPDLTVGEFSVDETGAIVATDGSLQPITPLSILRSDGEEVSFRVDNAGQLQAITPPDGGQTLVDNIFLDSPAGIAWNLTVSPLIGPITLQSPDETVWDVTIDNAGNLVSTPGSTNSPQNIKIERDDTTEVGIIIDNAGTVSVENPPNIKAKIRSNIYMESPDTTIWEVSVDNTDTIYTTGSIAIVQQNIIATEDNTTWSNVLDVQNDLCETIFKVQEFKEPDPLDPLTELSGAYLEIPHVTLLELSTIETIIPTSGAVVAEVYVSDNAAQVGTAAPRKAFYDTTDNEWKYVHDPSILVFP